MSALTQFTQLPEQICLKENAMLPKAQIVPKGVQVNVLGQVMDFSLLVGGKVEIGDMMISPSSIVVAGQMAGFCSVSPSSGFVDLVVEPLVSKDISAKQWEASLHYSKNESEVLLKNFLVEFKIDVNQNNKVWLLNTVASIVSLYESQYGIELSGEQRESLRNLALRMAYDRLRIR
jgi:hypothetical protein